MAGGSIDYQQSGRTLPSLPENSGQFDPNIGLAIFFNVRTGASIWNHSNNEEKERMVL